jgi:hypothetical protein
MAVISSFQDGDWHDTATWVGGVVPTSADDVVIDGGSVTLSADATCQSITGGQSNRTLTITADLTLTVLGLGGIQRTLGASVFVVVNTALSVVINGIIYPGNTTNRTTMSIGNSNVTINGLIDGSVNGSANTYAVSSSAGAVVTMNGDIIGKGGGTVAAVAGSGLWYVNGNVTANGFRAISGTHTVVLNGNATASNTAEAILCRRLNMNGTLTDSIYYSAVQTGKLSPLSGGDIQWNAYDETDVLRPMYTAGLLTGYPPEAKVEDGEVFGPSGEFTGELSPVTISAGQIADLANGVGLHLTPQVLAAITV